MSTDLAKEQRAAARAIDKAIRAAAKKLPLRSAKARNDMLSFAAGDMAEAYEIGVEEAQNEIVCRIHNIKRAMEDTKS